MRVLYDENILRGAKIMRNLLYIGKLSKAEEIKSDKKLLRKMLL